MRSTILIAAITTIFSISCSAQTNLAQTASQFLKTLSAQQQKKAVYRFTDNERYNWHYFPKSNRIGIPLSELSAQQKKAAYDLLKLCTGENGFQKVTGIIQLEPILNELEGRSDNYRDAGKYYFTFFGTPAEKEIWGWRLEGHHLSLTFSSKDNQLVGATPGFLGANPAIVPAGPHKGKQVLKEESDAGFTLLHSLKKDQLAKAIISNNSPGDIVTFVSRKAMIENPQGIKYSELDKEQQGQLLKLMDVYIHHYTKLFADDMMKDIKAAGLDKLQFAWAGSQQPGRSHYYRIQGPTIIIEFDNSQNNANHIHSVVRDLNNDFGGDELLEHYKKDHAGK